MNCAEFTASILEDYKTIKILSNKNGAEVIRLRNLQNGKDIILKKYSSAVPAYEVLKTIRHDNLPEIYDSFILDDGQIVLEEYIDGITVADVLESGRYTYKGASKVLEGVCLAVMTLHSYGIIHRDIKPENVMITNEGTVKLIDLNASRQSDPKKERDTVALGTIGYASPEQLGISASNEKTDIYAIGVLLNVMLTGEHPSKKLARGKAGRIVLKCTQIDPKHRYTSVGRLMRSL
ncbi:MAG: serine/threonine protein kinase [Clostridia bacterium]|nr:serine/threonine protein kinase [Clostridia bacterium]